VSMYMCVCCLFIFAVRVIWLGRLLSCLALHCGEAAAVDVGCQLLQSVNSVHQVSWHHIL